MMVRLCPSEDFSPVKQKHYRLQASLTPPPMHPWGIFADKQWTYWNQVVCKKKKKKKKTEPWMSDESDFYFIFSKIVWNVIIHLDWCYLQIS